MTNTEVLERFAEAIDAEGDIDMALREHGYILKNSSLAIEYEEFFEARKVLLTFLNRALAENDIYTEIDF